MAFITTTAARGDQRRIRRAERLDALATRFTAFGVVYVEVVDRARREVIEVAAELPERFQEVLVSPECGNGRFEGLTSGVVQLRVPAIEERAAGGWGLRDEHHPDFCGAVATAQPFVSGVRTGPRGHGRKLAAPAFRRHW
jgi:hypothetical protein